MKKLLVALSLASLSSVSAFADCSKVNLSGSWSEQTGSSSRAKTWDFMETDVIFSIEDSDSLGAYQRGQVRYTGTLETRTCILRLEAVETNTEYFREFESPKASASPRLAKEFKARESITKYHVVPESNGAILLETLDGRSAVRRLSKSE